MWLLTYVGALFNGLTLLILGEVIPTPYKRLRAGISKTSCPYAMQHLLIRQVYSTVLQYLFTFPVYLR